MTITHKEASSRILTLAREGRLIQHEWHRVEDGRELFGLMRRQVSSAEHGACALFVDEDAA